MWSHIWENVVFQLLFHSHICESCPNGGFSTPESFVRSSPTWNFGFMRNDTWCQSSRVAGPIMAIKLSKYKRSNGIQSWRTWPFFSFSTHSTHPRASYGIIPFKVTWMIYHELRDAFFEYEIWSMQLLCHCHGLYDVLLYCVELGYQAYFLIENKRSSIWQLCCHWWHRELSLWQFTVPPVTTKLWNWRPFVFSAPFINHLCISLGTLLSS